jgi:hypothetical protein
MRQFISQALVGAVALGSLVAGCGTTMLKLKSVSGDLAPATGQARVKRVGYGTAQVDVRLSDLAAIKTVDAAATHYVVWALTPGQGDVAQNLGSMNVSRNGTAKFRGFVTDTALAIFVTAEPTSAMSSPSGDELLWASVGPRGRASRAQRVASVKR